MGELFSAPGLLLWGSEFMRECRVHVEDANDPPVRGHYLVSPRSFVLSQAGYLRGMTKVWPGKRIDPGAGDAPWPYVEIPEAPDKIRLKVGEIDVDLQPAWLVEDQFRLPFIAEYPLEPGRYRIERPFFENKHAEPYLQQF